MKQKRCTELQIPHSNSQRLEHIKQYRRLITHRASAVSYTHLTLPTIYSV